MLWACFHFPILPLSAVFADAAVSPQPCALYQGPRQRPLIAYANDAAQKAGIRTGQAVATARALCAGLDLRQREPDAERHSLQLLAAWAYRFSAQVSRAEPDTLWLEVGASLTLFKGWSALHNRLHEELQALGFAAYRFAVAPVAAAARVLALSYATLALRQHGAMLTALGQASIALSGLPAETIAQLQGMGFRQLQELFALPRIELTRRIGPDNLRWLDTLRGAAVETLPLYQPPNCFARRIEFDSLIDNWQPLLFPLRRLVRELALYLHVRDSGVQRFELRLEHEDRATTRIPIGLLSVQREADALYEFARGRLERVEIAAAISAIALIADDLPVFQPDHRDLFEPARSDGLDWPALTERLRSRLGDEALHGLACVADHRPERAWRFSTGISAANSRETASVRREKKNAPPAVTSPSAAAVPGNINPRPLWLLAQPIPLRQPLAQILAGPERIESGWWDGADARRDYYIVRCSNGQRAWAFVAAGEHSGWMLHGWFA